MLPLYFFDAEMREMSSTLQSGSMSTSSDLFLSFNKFYGIESPILKPRDRSIKAKFSFRLLNSRESDSIDTSSTEASTTQGEVTDDHGSHLVTLSCQESFIPAQTSPS